MKKHIAPFMSTVVFVLWLSGHSNVGASLDDEPKKPLDKGAAYLDSALRAKDYKEFMTAANMIRTTLTTEEKKRMMLQMVDTIGSERTYSYIQIVDGFEMGTESGRTCFLISMLIGERVPDPLVAKLGAKKVLTTVEKREELMRSTFKRILSYCLVEQVDPVRGLTKEQKITLAKQKDCPIKTLVRLAEDPDIDVRYAVAVNSVDRLPVGIQDFIMADTDARIRDLFHLTNETLPPGRPKRRE